MKTQIMVSFAAITTISLLIITVISINNVGVIGNSINEESTDALESQIITNMKLSSSENAAIIQNKFQNAEASVARIVKATESIFSGDYIFNNVTSYRDNETESIPDAALNIDYGEVISPSTSTYYIPASVGAVTADINSTVNRSAHMDGLLSSIWDENPEYVWLYISFNDGVFRNFPGAHVDSDGLYTPTQEEWHTDAVTQRGELTYSEPYFDITQGLVVSLTQAVYVNNNVIAVVGLDFKTKTIQEKVLDVNFLDSGYASLMQSNDYTLIAHHEWIDQNEDDPIPLLTDIEVNNDGKSVFSAEDLSRMVSGDTDVMNYTRDGDSYFLSYSPVYERDGDALYTFLISVPSDEVIAAVNEIDNKISSAQNIVNTSTILLSLITIAVVLFVGLWISNSITKPISRLTLIAKQLTQNITKKDIFEGIDLSSDEINQDDEVGQLARSFTDMVGYLRTEQTKKKGAK